MTIINEAITPYTAGLDCGNNKFDGSAVAISLNRTRRRARREAARRTRTLRNLRWREIRRLKCPEFDCSRRKVTHVYAPAPLYFAMADFPRHLDSRSIQELAANDRVPVP